MNNFGGQIVITCHINLTPQNINKVFHKFYSYLSLPEIYDEYYKTTIIQNKLYLKSLH